MTLEGARVHAVCELMPYSGGLARNIEQCLNDFNIPLKLSHTVTQIHGTERLTGVTIAAVDHNRQPIPGTEEYIACDTLLLSVGLIPENELTRDAGISIDRVTSGAITDQDRQTDHEGIFACGNVLHVHDLVDYVSEEAEIAGKGAADYILGNSTGDKINVSLETDGKIRYTVPQFITKKKDIKVYFRVANIYKNVVINIKNGEEIVHSVKKRSVAPGEMESILLKSDMLTGKTKLSFELTESEA